MNGLQFIGLLFKGALFLVLFIFGMVAREIWERGKLR